MRTGGAVDRVVLVDDDTSVREALGQTLELEDLRPTLAGSFVAAKDHIVPEFAGVIVTDIRMPGKDGFYLLDYAHSVDPELPVILLTGEGDIPMAVKGISAGLSISSKNPVRLRSSLPWSKRRCAHVRWCSKTAA